MAQEPQTLRGCMEAQKECRREMFTHIDEQHTNVMGMLLSIEKKLAYEKGRQSATGAQSPIGKRISWSVILKILVILTALVATAVTVWRGGIVHTVGAVTADD